MIIRNWRDIKPGIAHEVGIDYQLLKGQALRKEGDPFAQMEGFMYIAFAML